MVFVDESNRISIGLDLGQKHDPTAIVVVQTGFDGKEWHHQARFLQRMPLGTSYPDVVKRVSMVASNAVVSFSREMWQNRGIRIEYYPRLYVDATGLGQPVIDLLKGINMTVSKIHPCYFTHGDRRIVSSNREIKIGKAWLVSRLQVLLQSGRLHIAKSAESEALIQELLDYEIRISEDSNTKYGAFSVGSHDDLVTALGLACQEDEIPVPLVPFFAILTS
jgi:hypothetical protein